MKVEQNSEKGSVFFMIGVIGGGVMGSGIAQNLVESGFEVVVLDINEVKLSECKRQIKNTLRFRGLYRQREYSESHEVIMSRLMFQTDYNSLNEVQFVIESATEDLETKKGIFQRIDQICHKDSIFMTNTSCISITELASHTSRPDKVIGTHFMNPVPLKNAVEVIKGVHTSELCIKAVGKLLGRMGKEFILVDDYPGFVSNRISHLFMNEAAFVVQDQVASAQDVDNIFKKCYGHPMGPLETADLIGLDTVVQSLKVLYECYQDPKFRCCPLLIKMVNAGFKGRKSGKGFYTY